MYTTSLIVNITSWKKPIWIVIILSALILLAIILIFQHNVEAIDHKLDNIRTYESK
jgi:hypothetical protein